ncbi:hypothetical protein MMC18_000431 [Xylographa bjoerkii]|nr:hypothetical protein [Xylographa bjoerkii]
MASRKKSEARESSTHPMYCGQRYCQAQIQGSIYYRNQAIIEVRKKERTWELEAWDECSKNVDSRAPEEGLVTFADQEHIRVNQEITPVLYGFKDHLDEVVARRRTAMFDATLKAAMMLVSSSTTNPQAKRQIVFLTDDMDKCSESEPETLCGVLFKHDIVLDAIVIGTGETRVLFKIAKHTDGYAFNPKARDLLFQIFPWLDLLTSKHSQIFGRFP